MSVPRDHSTGDQHRGTTYVFPPADPLLTECDSSETPGRSSGGGLLRHGLSKVRKMSAGSGSGSGEGVVFPAGHGHSASQNANASSTRGISPTRPRKPPLLKTSSLGLGTSTFGSEGEKSRAQGTSATTSPPPTSGSTAASSLSNICSSTGSGSSGVSREGLNPSHAHFSVTGVGTNNSAVGVPGSGANVGSSKMRPKSALKGHTRSASHGGMTQPGRTVDIMCGDTTVTKSSVLTRGHTRAASHGQIVEDSPQGLKNRAPSKTDFILPPGHKNRGRLSSTTAPKDSNWRGHSRQASRSESIYTLRQSKIPMKNKILFWRRTEPEIPRSRMVFPNHTVHEDVHPNGSYPNNRIRTTKYTLISFLPKNLFEQFHRFANLYFISIVLLNWIPPISAFGKEIAMLPVMFVLGVTAIKDLFEDRRRYNSDKRINNSSCRIWNRKENRFESTRWKDIRVGDIVHLSCNELIPADILVLQTSDENGLCYIETMNLDGESNLKQREVVRGFAEKHDEFDVSKFKSKVEIGPPTTKIYHFTGKMVHSETKQVPLSKDNLLLRDCCLKNTDYVEGMVLYAGRETKAMLNNGGPRHKRTGLEKLMNLEVIWCIVILAVLCIVGATGSAFWLNNFWLDKDHVPFIDPNIDNEEERGLWVKVFFNFLTFIIILQVMIPLSLYVTIELTKLMQIYHIHNDIELFDPETNKRIECRAMNIPEDLGQIQYIFSDKTGTLTENKMVFRRCTIGAVDYNHAEIPSEPNCSFPKNSLDKAIPLLKVNPTLFELFGQWNIQLSVESGNLHEGYSDKAERIREFFLILSICNTVVVAKHPHVDKMNVQGELEEEGMDEDALNIPRLSTIRESLDSSLAGSISSSGTFLPPSELQSEPDSVRSLSQIRLSTNELVIPPHVQGSKRPSKPLKLKSDTRPLSPISSSNETTPTESPAQLPRLFHNLIPKRLSRTFLLQSNSPAPPSTPSPMEPKPIFEAESPDELALVEAAYLYNCRLVKRSPQSLTVTMPGDGPSTYEILHTFPFDSVRKRMSIIVRHPRTSKIIMYTKGADSAIFPKLKQNGFLQSEILNRTQIQIDNYAREGLRTLVMAKRVLSESEYKEWHTRFIQAELDLDRRDELMSDAYDIMEDKLELVGATGIEDRLQDRVPETIEALRKAGIVVWVLTGDKQETAINISYSCKLFAPNMDIIKLNARSKDSAEKTILFYLNEIERIKSESVLMGNQYQPQHRREASTSSEHRWSEVCAPLVNKERALVVDGRTLTYILDQKTQLITKFLALTKHCASVLCCRATPLQKAFIVSSVKEQLGMRTLAVGDGANDVSMIQRADVGIGISGKEGMQAVMASDFAISKFKYLERLLLVHGHWCYDRLARMILYFFYKNAAFVFVIFWYQLLNGWSGSVMIDQMYLMVFNLFFTALPPMAIGIYDQDCPADLLLQCPKLYGQGRLQKVHQPHSFWLNMLDSLYQSVVIFFMAYGAYNGSDVGMFEFGTTVVVACMFTMLVHMAIEAKSWTILHVLSIVFSFLVFYSFAFVYNTVCINCLGFENPFWVIHEIIRSPIHWLIVTVTTVLAVLPRLIVRCLENSLFPSEVSQALLAARQAALQNEEYFVSRSSSSSSIIKGGMPWSCFRKQRGEVTAIPTATIQNVSALPS